MDIDRKRVEDDLRGVVVGEVFCDELSVQLYASDASVYQVLPLGVIRPRSAADVVACVQYANEQGLSIHARGAGSGEAGESLGGGLVIDFSVAMRQWRRLPPVSGSPVTDRVRVQPGVVLANLNRDLAPDGHQFGPDPATRSVTTMGSVLAVNASGSHYLRSGSARDTVVSLEVVTGTGELLELGSHSPFEPTPAGRLARNVWGIFRRHREAIQQDMLRRGASNGLRLDKVIEPFDSLLASQPTTQTRVDLAKLLVGTQGTFGLITDATLRTEPVAAHRGVALLFFHRLDTAARGAVAAVRHGVVACDLMDRRLLEIARDTEWAFANLLPRDAEAMVLVEIQGQSIADVRSRLAALQTDLCQKQKLAFASTTTMERQQRDLYWSLSRRVIPRLYRVRGDHSPVPLIEDVWIQPESLPGTLTAIQDVLKTFQVTSTIFAHAGHGQLHIRPFLDLGSQRERGRLRALSEQIAEAVWACGGLVGSEHAAGRSRSWLLARQHQAVWPAMLQLKQLFDPHERLNPGKLVSTTAVEVDDHLRPVRTTIRVTGDQQPLIEASADEQQVAEMRGLPVRELPVVQQWGLGRQIEDTVRACNGCGRCRTSAPDQRQCPMFRITQTEEASPRAKANLLRGVLTGDLDPTALAADRAKEIADLCFGCHQCRLECPASVDIPKLVNEIKAQYVATNGLRLSDLLLSRIDMVSAVASRIPSLTNVLMRNRLWRWLMERAFGIAQARSLPALASQSFLQYAVGRRWHRPSSHGSIKVAYFVDHYATYHDPEIGIALAEILLHNEIDFYVPPRQIGSGMARIAAGDARGAQRIARRNVRILAEAVRQGYVILVTEPAAALALKREYLHLLDDEDAKTVADHCYEACQYLWDLHQQDRLSLQFDTVSAEVAYHQPCHVRALDSIRSGQRLMELIPGISVQPVERGCSGMAGPWGLQRINYRNSLRIGWPLITAMRSHTAHAAATECSACKMQIEHGSGRSTVHPLKILAHAYGRLPGFEKQLRMMPVR